jgi:phosphatidylinositol glycan class M
MATMTATTAKHPGPASPTLTLSLFAPVPLFTIAAALRAALLAYGLWQDANSALKYTDIDYLVFTDAARAVARGGSPYARETYRYTPLLAWLLAPSIQLAESLGASGRPAAALAAFSAGKVLFAAADLVAGWLLLKILRRTRTTKAVASSSVAEAFSPGAFAALWLWNPMVATISTRGSSEGLLGVLVAALLCAALEQRVLLAGALLGLGVHFKIYPFVYAPAIVWWMDAERMSGESEGRKPELGATWTSKISAFFTAERILFGASSLVVFLGLNAAMYMM